MIVHQLLVKGIKRRKYREGNPAVMKKTHYKCNSTLSKKLTFDTTEYHDYIYSCNSVSIVFIFILSV